MQFGNQNNGIMGGGIMGGGAPQGGGLPGFATGGQPGVMGNAPMQHQAPQALPQHMQPMPMHQMPGQQQIQQVTPQFAELMGLSDLTSGGIMGEGTTMGATTILIRSIALGATRPQQSQWRRGYDVTVTSQGINEICNRIVQSSNRTITPMDMVNMFSDPTLAGRGVVQYSGTPEAKVDIENGWDIGRFRFVIVADIMRAGRHITTEVISGYTDEMGVHNAHLPNSMSVNPNMVFVVNNVTTAGIQHSQGSAGVTSIAQMRNSDAVLRNTQWSGVGSSSQLYMTRPHDVATTYSKLPLYEGLMERSNGFSDVKGSSNPFMLAGQPGGAGATVLDMDSTLAGNAKMAKTASNLPSTFSSRLINGIIQDQLPECDPMQMDGTATGALSASRMREQHFSSQNFVSAISRIARNNIASNAQFTYQDLLRLDPTADDRCTVYMQGRELNTSAIYVPDGTSVSNVAEATPEGIAATSIAQGLVGMMLVGGISLICITATNAGGSTVVVPTAFDGMDSDGMLANRVHAMCTRLQLEVFDIITMRDTGDMFTCEIIADGFNDIFIKISLNNGPFNPFVYPAYSSSSSSPMVTNNPGKSHALASGVNDVIHHIKSAINDISDMQRPSFGGGGTY